MNLKEAFRFQNKLQSLMDDAKNILDDRRNITQTKNTYLRSKVVPDAEDEITMEDIPNPEYAENITSLAEFLIYLLDEREKLSRAVMETKKTLPIDMDSECSLNRQRQDTAEMFRKMADTRSSENIIYNGVIGYRFNAEGNQVSYKCPVKKVVTINFDRNKLRKMLSDLDKKSDSVSVELDKCLINYEINYEPPFDVNDSFANVFEKYLSNN